MAKNNPGKKKDPVASKEKSAHNASKEVDEKLLKSSPEEESEDIQEEELTEEEKIEQLEKELGTLSDKYIRLIAEYDNYRKRTLREKIELSRQAGEKIFVDILPVIDDFERALQHLEGAEDLNSVKEGIEIIYNKFIAYLSRQGVKEIETFEQAFDAELHEAVTKIAAPNEKLKGKIVDCVEKGYKLDDKVIRYPKVVVGE